MTNEFMGTRRIIFTDQRVLKVCDTKLHESMLSRRVITRYSLDYASLISSFTETRFTESDLLEKLMVVRQNPVTPKGNSKRMVRSLFLLKSQGLISR